MPFINSQIWEAFKRQSTVTEYIIYPLQNTDIGDYQILLTNVPSIAKEDVTVVHNNKILPHWVESKGNVWTKLPKLFVKMPQKIYTLTGNPSAASASNGVNVFDFFDDFSGNLDKWTLTQSAAGNVQIVDGSLKIIGSNAWNANGATSNKNINRPAILEWKSYAIVTAQTSFVGYSVQPLSYTSGLNLLRDISTFTRWLDGSAANFGTWTAAWTVQKIILKPTAGYTIFDNNIQKEDNTTWTTTGNKFAFQKFEAVNPLYIDDVRVRKYASSEPIVKKIRTLNKPLFKEDI